MGDHVSIRWATAVDGQRISALLAAFRSELGYAADAVAPLPVSHEGPLHVALAERARAAVGLAAAHRCHALVRGTRFMLVTDIYVLAAHRRRGIATRLLNEVIALARRYGCADVVLSVEGGNEATVASAMRTGFVQHSDLLLRYPLLAR